MTGKEKFEYNGQELGYDLSDFWRFHYSNIYDIQGRIAEFIVAKALEVHQSQNDRYWTLWDLTYKGLRIEIKETSYYHSFNAEGKISRRRSFGIGKAHGSYDPLISGNSDYRRQNDVYVFCLNTGDTQEESYPLNLNNWEFYIVPTSVINERCGDNKTVSLNRIKKLGYAPTPYEKIKTVMDELALLKAHDLSHNHKSMLMKRQKCGCFYCLSVFDSSKIENWLEHPNPCDCKGTALCPECGIDSVIGESSGFPITEEFLKAMRAKWFE